MAGVPGKCHANCAITCRVKSPPSVNSRLNIVLPIVFRFSVCTQFESLFDCSHSILTLTSHVDHWEQWVLAEHDKAGSAASIAVAATSRKTTIHYAILPTVWVDHFLLEWVS